MIKVGILTVNGKAAAGEIEDSGGIALMELAASIKGEVLHYVLIPEEKNRVASQIKTMVDQMDLELVFTVGAIGFTAADIASEGTREVIDKEVPGLAEKMRANWAQTDPAAIFSRVFAGVRKKALIINLPFGPEEIRQALSGVLELLPQVVAMLRGGKK